MRASQYILVRHGTLRIVDYPRDGVYSLLDFDSQSSAYRYLQRFSRNPLALQRLQELLDDQDEDEEDEDEEEDDDYSGRSRPAHAVPQKRDILAEVAELIADEELGVAEEVHRTNPPTKLDEVQPESIAAPPPEPLKTPKKTTYIEIKVIDDASGQPVNWVRLIIKTPDGNENFYTTNSSGLVRIDDLDPGTCDVRCDLKDARLTDTLSFVGTGDAKPAAGANGNGNGSSGSGALRIAEVEEHKVKKGESIASLAAKAGMKWQDLAKFNWGTDVPDEINKHLRGEVGCTHKTADGKNYRFDDTDDPGIMLIPQKWERLGLATGQTHIYTVRALQQENIDLVIPLERDLDSDPDKDDEIRLQSDDGSYSQTVKSNDPRVEAHESGRLLKYLFEDVPPGIYSVAVKIAEKWCDVLLGLRVTRIGAKYDNESFVGSIDGNELGAPEDEVEEMPEQDDEQDDENCSCGL